jgi:zinc protease
MKTAWIPTLLVMSSSLWAAAGPKVVALPGQSPLVTFRFVFLTGSASDPADKPGVAALTAALLAQGGTREMTYKQIVDAMFPMATSVSQQADKEMIAFSGTTHVDNLQAFYKIFRAMLLDPGWRQDDFNRLRDDAVNYLRVSLRGNNDEELGKEVLYNQIYAGHPYGHENIGAISALEKMTLADLQAFYRAQFTQANLIIGLAGGYPEAFLNQVKKDFSTLPAGPPAALSLPAPKPVRGIRMTLVEKNTRSVAYSIGFPLGVKRGDPDYPALLVAQSYLGQHRLSGGRLYERLRQARGLNYGDYAYIEYFPRGMFQFEPDPNLARRQQIFQIWIRPVEPPTAHFALRLALYEFDKFVKEGLSEEAFQRTRTFLAKYVNLLTKTKRAELGYAIDSRYYGISDYNGYLKNSLAGLTRDDVSRAIRKHLGAAGLDIVVVAKNCEELKKMFLDGAPSPMTYNSPKPPEVLEEDKIVERWKIDLPPDAVRILPVEKVFE